MLNYSLPVFIYMTFKYQIPELYGKSLKPKLSLDEVRYSILYN